MKTFVLFLTVIAFICKPGYCQPVKIGALLDLSKEYAMESAAFREGIELAIFNVNSGGGVKGRSLELVLEDTQYNMRNVLSASQKLIHLDKVKAALVGTYTEAMVAGPVFEKAKIPLINIWDSAPDIEALGDYVFGIGVWTPSSSDQTAAFARERLKAKSAVTICSNGEWSLKVAEEFRRKFKAAGGTILGYFEVNPAESDFRTVLAKAKSLVPDVLYAPVTDNIPAFWLQLARIGFNRPVMTSDILNQEILSQISGAAEGVYQTQSMSPDYPATKKMLALYKKRFNKECTQVFYTSLGYDSVMLLADSMKRRGLESQAVKDGLYEISNFPGASGPATMTAEGSVRRMVSVFQVRGNRLEPVL